MLPQLFVSHLLMIGDAPIDGHRLPAGLADIVHGDRVLGFLLYLLGLRMLWVGGVGHECMVASYTLKQSLFGGHLLSN